MKSITIYLGIILSLSSTALANVTESKSYRVSFTIPGGTNVAAPSTQAERLQRHKPLPLATQDQITIRNNKRVIIRSFVGL